VQWEERKINKAAFQNLQEALGDKMLDIKIRKNKSVEEISYMGEPLLMYDPKATATQDYVRLTEKIMEIMG
jgi:cellulose biosynthesis protein BcsQ